MNGAVLEFVRELDLEDVGTQITMQCAPFLMGLKLSNLLMISNTKLYQAESVLRASHVPYEVLLITQEKAAVLLYDKRKLERYLSGGRVQQILIQMGYDSLTLQAVLSRFKGRYQAYMTQGREFPHEMGVLLGYPAEDVEGFIRNGGENFLYAGYWKVYGNLPSKLKLFQQFEAARKYLLQHVLRGMDIADIINQSMENTLHGAAV